MNIIIKNNINITISDDFQKLNSMPEDPKNSIAYGKQTNSSDCFVLLFPIELNAAMPFGNNIAVIDGIHSVLKEDQGLIEVKSGVTQNNNEYIYSIVKTKLEPSGMQYCLTMHIKYVDEVLNVQGFFSEKGITGQRDTAILNKLVNDGVIIMPDMSGWMQDPYNANYLKGIRMNLSEKREYDSYFPEHPLSEMRKLIDVILK